MTATHVAIKALKPLKLKYGALNDMQDFDLDKTRVIKGICDYHNIVMSKELQEIWLEDLMDCTGSEIKSAWNLWRKSGYPTYKKPTSYELFLLIDKPKREQMKAVAVEEKSLPLVQGRGYLEDVLISNMKLMFKNNPGLVSEISRCESMYDKVGICAVALGRSELVKSPMLVALMKGVTNGYGA